MLSILERWTNVSTGCAVSGAVASGEGLLCSRLGGLLDTLAVLRLQKLASSPVDFFTLSPAFSSFLESFSRIRHPEGTSSTGVSVRDLTDVSQAVDPFAARRIDIGLVRANAVFRESLTASAIAFAVKLLPEGGSCGSVRAGT
jgi:hypothetical protein